MKKINNKVYYSIISLQNIIIRYINNEINKVLIKKNKILII